MSTQRLIISIAVGLAIGILMSAQIRVKPKRVDNPLAPYLALTNTRDRLVSDNLDLRQKIENLRVEVANDQRQAKDRQSVNKDQLDEIERLEQEIGLTQVEGPGLVITLDDAKSGEVTLDTIVHASDIRDVTNTLWLGGAQAINVNGERLTALSSIDSIVNTVIVNTTRITTPFVINVIGDQDKLLERLSAPDTLADLYRRSKEYNLILKIERQRSVQVAPYRGSFAINHAQLIAP